MDVTECFRRERVTEINSNPKDRAMLASEYGQVWDTKQLGHDFEVLGFLAPFVNVRRKKDSAKGTLEFQHHPRFYFSFVEDTY